MPQYIVGRAGFEYNDEYYYQTEGMETAVEVVPDKKTADKRIKELTLRDVRKGIDLYRLQTGDWDSLSDDEVFDKLKKIQAELYTALPIGG